MARREEEPAEGPQWMTTMSDMNTLLMTFFIILFSLVVDRSKASRGEGTDPAPESMQESHPDAARLNASPHDSKILAGWEPGPTPLPARSDTVRIADGVECRITSTPAGTILTLGGEFGAFDEGGWELKPAHATVLRELLKWMASQRYRILIRGFTAGNLEDSVVRENGRIRKFRASDWDAPDPQFVSDHWLLASLRAGAVRTFLVQGTEGRRIAPERIEVQVEAFNEAVADNLDRAERHRNRRVELVILPRE